MYDNYIAPPPGFVLGPDGLYENPQTGDWIDTMGNINPGGGQSFASGGSTSPIGNASSLASMYDMLPSSAASSAAQGGMSMAPTATEAALQIGAGAPTQAANMSVAPALPGAFDLAGIGSAGNFLLPAAGALGAYHTAFKPSGSYGKNALKGAASGAAMGSYFGPPGAVVGGVLGGLGGFAASKFRDKDQWKTEGNRLDKLTKDGAYIPEHLRAEMPTKGRSYESMMNQSVDPDFIGFDPSGRWTNNKFNMSRNVADLRPEDIVNYATFAERDKDWFRKDMNERLAFADKTLKAGAVTEGKGSVNVDWKKFDSQPSQTTDIKPMQKDPGRKTAPAGQIPKAASQPAQQSNQAKAVMPRMPLNRQFAFIPRRAA